MSTLRLAVASDGALHDPTLMFLNACGIGVERSNSRRYTAAIPSLPGVSVLFQRGSDIPLKVEEGSADMGIVGRDRLLETRRDGGSTSIVIEALGYGHCELVLGVPDAWVDVTSLADLADLALEFREQGQDLRIVTKSPRLVERFLLGNGVNYFSLVHSSGTLEAAPAMGYADMIADLSTSGATMRENRLKPISGGTILASEACLISNRETLATDEGKRELGRVIVEMMEAHLRSREVYSITANMRGETPEDLARYVLEQADISGMRGPTISKVYAGDGDGWFAVTVIVERRNLIAAVDQLRRAGGDSVSVSQPKYVFKSESAAQDRLA